MTVSLTFLSNTMTHPFGRFLPEFDVSHSDLNSVASTLQSRCSSEFLVVLLDYSFFSGASFLKNEVEQKLAFVAQLLRVFRGQNSTKILLANVACRFVDFCSGKNIEQYGLLLELNAGIQRIADEISDCAVINVFDLMVQAGEKSFFNERNRYLYQTPFTKIAYEVIAAEIRKKTLMLTHPRKKVLVLDADNTLWGGVVGEDGVQGIAIDENYPGIVFRRFQEQVKVLQESGIVLALCSKNNEPDVRSVFDSRKMPLSWGDFVATRVNWLPKSQNIVEIAKELNLGLDSVVFADDSAFEIEEVRAALPMVEVLHVSTEDHLSNLSLFPSFYHLNAVKITLEDRQKTEQYLAETKRQEVAASAASIEDYIRSLGLKLEYSINNRNNIARIAQLFLKTNQFNMTTRRYSEADVEALMGSELVFDCRVLDKFGDMGTVGVVVVKKGRVDSFLLSCRVLGRQIENAFLRVVQDHVGLVPFYIEYVETAKNAPAKDYLARSGFVVDRLESNGVVVYSRKDCIGPVAHISIVRSEQ